MSNIDVIFSPQSVAVLGASTTKGKVGYDVFANIINGGFTGSIYPINPGANSILSHKTYKSVLDVPDSIDLGVIILPPKAALKAAEECIQKGVRGLLIISAGFREAGPEGRAIEDSIVAMCKNAGIRLVGPNCLGVINPSESVRLNASFSVRMPQPGNISFISQSGALCTAVLDFAADRDFGFSKFISIGNKADLDELDLLRYLHEDPDTDVIMIYLEELRRGSEFIEAVKKITSGDRPKPILAIKSGRTSAGAAAAASHTGSLAGSEAVYDAIFSQSGIIRCNTIDELFDFANAFAYKKKSPLGKIVRKMLRGNKIAIVTNAGGPGILATDMTISSGMELAKFTPETMAELAKHLPATANIHNPVDVIGDAASDRYQNALSAVINDKNVDGVLVILTPQSMTDALGTAEAVVNIAQRSNKPILCCFMGIIDVSEGVKFLQEHGYPVYRFPENAANAFGALYRYAKWVSQPQLDSPQTNYDTQKASLIIKECLASGNTRLGELVGNELLACYGFNILPTKIAKTNSEASSLSAEMGFPVVMKIVSPQILHKSDAGGVIVGIKTAQDAQDAFDKIIANAVKYDPQAQIDGVLIVKMAPAGEEIIIGATRYPVFGPLLMFGTGGIFVEVFKDVEFGLAPINMGDARQMIKRIKGFKMLQGFRGKPVADIHDLEIMLLNLSALVTNHPEIKEIDVNPLLVHAEGKGTTVADCRIILEAVQ